MEVVSASVDSAGVQVEYLVDEGSTWQQYDYGMPLYSLATSYANKINLYNTYLNSLYLKFL